MLYELTPYGLREEHGDDFGDHSEPTFDLGLLRCAQSAVGFKWEFVFRPCKRRWRRGTPLSAKVMLLLSLEYFFP